MASSRTKRSTKSTGKTISKKSNTRSGKNTRKLTKAQADAIALEEQRAMSVRRDIRMLVFFGVMVFLMISALGYGGIIGRAVSSVMFGLFGTAAYGFPVFMTVTVFFVVSNFGKRTLPARTAALIMLFVCAAAAFEMISGEISTAEAYDPAVIYQRCAAAREGGGLLGGTIAYYMFRLLRSVGSVFVLAVIILISLMVFTQFSPVERYRKAQAERIRRGDPSFMEKRKLRAQEAKAASIARKEAAAASREKRRKEREELLLIEEQNREERRRATEERAASANMTETLIEPYTAEEEEDFGLDEGSSLFRKREKRRQQNIDEIKASDRQEEKEEKPEKLRSGTPHGIRLLDRRKKEAERPSEIRVSASPVRDDDTGVDGRILRPDANTVRVESEGLIMADMIPDPLTGPSSRQATMTVFTRTKESPDTEEDLQFPFNRSDADRNIKKVYARESAAEKLLSGTYPDIADAGGMSTFSAQEKRSALMHDTQEEMISPAPFEEEELPWGADALTEEEMAAIEAQEASFTAVPQTNSAAEQGRETEKAASVPEEKRRVTVTARPVKEESRASNADAAPAAGSISEEDLGGIEVHRERGEAEKAVGRTVMSGQQRSAQNRKYSFPPFSLMTKVQQEHSPESDNELRETAFRLQETLRTFGVNVTISDISQGPSITRYELQPEQGVKVSRIVNLADDIKLSLAATDIRIEAPIPGKPAIGIEVPNKHRSPVALRDILESKEFRTAKSLLTFSVGKDVAGKIIVADIAKMPHLLIAGATGAGKSVCINTIIMSILYKASPDEVQMIMIDPKVVELSVYNGIPHLMIPVVTDVKKASAALNWAVAEMDRRYKLFAASGTRDLTGYNAFVRSKGEEAEEGEKPLSRVVVIVDELADLMMTSKNDVETSICRLAQLARAAGIHLIIATQRPSVNVITGLIKANMPSRIAFQVASNTDSRTILDMGGAEKLIGKGDMLFYPSNFPKPERYQGAFVSDEDVSSVVNYIRQNNSYDNDIASKVDDEINKIGVSGLPGQGSDAGGDSGRDEYFERAGRFIIEKDKASIGMLQRVLKIGFNRAARIMDQLAEAGVVAEENGTRAREVTMSMPEFEQYLEEH